MEFSSLQLVDKTVEANGVMQYLLIPDLTSEQLYSPLYQSVVLSICWRLRRNRNYVLASIDEGRIKGYYSPEDEYYVRSTPVVRLIQYDATYIHAYQLKEDISPFMPVSEDDFLIFLPSLFLLNKVVWSDLIAKSNAILLQQCDEFIKIQTSDLIVASHIERLPKFRS